MGNTAAQNTHLSIKEYLAYEEQADYKNEYYNGEILAMAGGTRNHSVICFNLIRRIGEAIDDKDCTGFDSNMKLRISAVNSFVYPDIMVVCGDIGFVENRNDIIKNPVLIIEVLSPNTQAFDRGEKFAYYRTLPSLQEYVLVSQHEPMAEVYDKQDEKRWLYTAVKGLEEKMVLDTIHCEFALKEIYRKVEWGSI